MASSYQDVLQRLLWLGHEGRSLKWDLENTRRVLERLGNPERKFRSIHIAGTNGKGSVAAMVERALRAAGHKTGLYTSPHLVRINERIAVGGAAVSDEEFAAAFGDVEEVVEALLAEGRLPDHPSFFETLTAMAFQHFARAGVEAAVLEVGMGGRLDATNVVTPDVSVITAIDFDHERYLGHSIEEIAGEKAGIIKPGVPVVSAAEHLVARRLAAERANSVGAPLVDVEADYRAEDVRAFDFGRYEFTIRAQGGFEMQVAPSLRGEFQIRNALAAVATLRELERRGWKLSSDAIADGLRSAQWGGRMELVRREPLVFLDGAHNPAGARQVRRFWEEHLAGRRIHLVYGTVRDKAVAEVAELLFPPVARVIVTQPSSPRAASASTIAQLAPDLNLEVVVAADPARALRAALEGARPNDVVFVTGSLFLVGDCKQALEPEPAAVASVVAREKE
jgi:dihydrofolate synthase/folylpolyglutamate synthase